MEKVSDYAKNELNWLIFKHFTRFFLIGIALMLIKTMEIVEIVPVNMFGSLFYGITVVFLLFWSSERKLIVAENEDDIMREDDIKDFCAHYAREDLKISEEWMEKDFSSACLIKYEEKEKLQLSEPFGCKIALDMQRDNNSITHTTEAQIFFIPTDRPTLNIKTLDFLALLPHVSDANHLLKQIFASVTERYHKRKNLKENMNYTAKALSGGLKKIDKHINDILIKKFPDALKIFLSGEEFQIAGKMLKGEDNKELFLLTGIKTEKQEIILFPTKTLIDITNDLRSRLAY